MKRRLFIKINGIAVAAAVGLSACNDDIDTQGMNYLSSVTFEAEANQVVTVVVDGFQGSFAGTYTVQVTAQ